MKEHYGRVLSFNILLPSLTPTRANASLGFARVVPRWSGVARTPNPLSQIQMLYRLRYAPLPTVDCWLNRQSLDRILTIGKSLYAKILFYFLISKLFINYYSPHPWSPPIKYIKILAAIAITTITINIGIRY